MKEVVMPGLGMAMTEGTVISWLRQPGEAVEAGEAIAEIETDKVTVELESPASGILGDLLVSAGSIALVGTVLTRIIESSD